MRSGLGAESLYGACHQLIQPHVVKVQAHRAFRLQFTGSKQIFDQAVLWALGLPTGFAAADFDRDRDVDGADFITFVACVTGPDHGPPVSGCDIADLDGDQDIDADDFGRLQRCLNSPGLIANPTCSD